MNKLFRLFLLVIFLINISACSYLTKRMVGDSASTQTVPKAQYDELLSKYDVLLKERGKAEEVEEISASSLISSVAPNSDKAGDDSLLIDRLSDSSLGGTVDLFEKDGKADPTLKAQIENSNSAKIANKGPENIENELLILAKAKAAADKNEYKKALGFLTEIENSQNEQIKVRAKFHIADLLFRQEEFDLAMQAYEDIITNYAFSGVAVATLGRLVVCAEKLKLAQKRDHYYSLLHDVFQME